MKGIRTIFLAVMALLSITIPSLAGGVIVRSSGDPLIIRRAEDDSSGNPVSTGTTTLSIWEQQADGSFKIYDWTAKSFVTTGATSPTANMVNQSVNGSATGVWTAVIASADASAAFTKGRVYVTSTNNALASPPRDREVFVWGGGDGDISTDSSGYINSHTKASDDKTGYSLVTAPPTATAIRQEMDTNSTKLSNLDAAVSSRFPSASYIVPPTVAQMRVEMDNNSSKLVNLDAAVSSRLAGSAYNAPTLSQITATYPANFGIQVIDGSGRVTTSNPGSGSGSGTDPFTNTTGTYATPGTMGYYIAHSLSTYSGGDTTGITSLLARTDPTGALTAIKAKTDGLSFDGSSYLYVNKKVDSATVAPSWYTAPPTADAVATAVITASDQQTDPSGLTRKQSKALLDCIDHQYYKSNKNPTTGVVTARYYGDPGLTVLYATSVYTPQTGNNDATRVFTYAAALLAIN